MNKTTKFKFIALSIYQTIKTIPIELKIFSLRLYTTYLGFNNALTRAWIRNPNIKWK